MGAAEQLNTPGHRYWKPRARSWSNLRVWRVFHSSVAFDGHEGLRNLSRLQSEGVIDIDDRVTIRDLKRIEAEIDSAE
jgi:hypothetical protein